jgi:hypothetical protein
MRPPQPQDQEGRDAEKPHRGHDAVKGRGEVPLADECRQNGMVGGRDPGRKQHRNADRNGAPEDRSTCRSLYFGAAILVFQERIAEHEKRKSAVPDHVEPGCCLRSGAQQSTRGKQAWKGQAVDNSRDGGEQISARKQQQSPRPQQRELRIQQDGRDKIVDRERGLVTRNERRHRNERHRGKIRRKCEQHRRDADNGQGGPAIATCGRKGREKDASLAARRLHCRPPASPHRTHHISASAESGYLANLPMSIGRNVVLQFGSLNPRLHIA